MDTHTLLALQSRHLDPSPVGSKDCGILPVNNFDINIIIVYQRLYALHLGLVQHFGRGLILINQFAKRKISMQFELVQCQIILLWQFIDL